MEAWSQPSGEFFKRMDIKFLGTVILSIWLPLDLSCGYAPAAKVLNCYRGMQGTAQWRTAGTLRQNPGILAWRTRGRSDTESRQHHTSLQQPYHIQVRAPHSPLCRSWLLAQTLFHPSWNSLCVEHVELEYPRMVAHFYSKPDPFVM